MNKSTTYPCNCPLVARYQQYGPLFSGSYPESSETRPVQAAINLGSFNALQPARQHPPFSSLFLLSPCDILLLLLHGDPTSPPTLMSVFAYAHNSQCGLPFTINFIKSLEPLPVASLLPYLNNGFSKSRFQNGIRGETHVFAHVCAQQIPNWTAFMYRGILLLISKYI